MQKNDMVKYKSDTKTRLTFRLICRYEKVKGFPFWRVQEFFNKKPTKFYFLVLESVLETV